MGRNLLEICVKKDRKGATNDMAKVAAARQTSNQEATKPQVSKPTTLEAGDTLIPPEGIDTGEPEPILANVTAREVDVKMDEIKAKRQLPKLPGAKGTIVSFDVFINWTGLLTPDMWNHVLVYVYRHFPVIDRQKLDPSGVKYIDVITEPITYQEFVEKHGGGKYGFMVCDTEIQQHRSIFEARLSIPMGQYEPKLDLAELVTENRDNISYVAKLRADGRLDSEGNVIEKGSRKGNMANSNVGGNEVVTLVKEFMGMFAKMNQDQQANIRAKVAGDGEGTIGKAIGDILLEKMKQEDPSKTVSMITALMQAMKSKTEDTSNTGNVFLQMMQMQAEHSKQMMEMMKIQLTPKESNGEEKDEFSKLKQLLEIAEMIKGGSRGGSRSGWDIGLDFARELAAPLLTTFNNILSLRKGGVPMANQPPMTEQQMLAAAGMPSTNQPTSNPSNQPVTVPLASQLAPLVQQYGGMLIQQIQSGKKGWEFAEDLVRFSGPAPHAMIAKFQVTDIISTMKQIPELWGQLEPIWGEEYLTKWVGEFINYEEIIAQMEDGTDGEDLEDTPKTAANLYPTTQATQASPTTPGPKVVKGKIVKAN